MSGRVDLKAFAEGVWTPKVGKPMGGWPGKPAGYCCG